MHRGLGFAVGPAWLLAALIGPVAKAQVPSELKPWLGPPPRWQLLDVVFQPPFDNLYFAINTAPWPGPSKSEKE